ncbi:unnamed protein product, partial [Effrenium voratum]
SVFASHTNTRIAAVTCRARPRGPPVCMGKKREEKAKDEEDKPLPPAKSIFEVKEASGSARCGELLGRATPCFTQLTSRGVPLCLRPEVLQSMMEAHPFLYQLPVCDLLLRQEGVSQCPDASSGCRGFWPHLKPLTYCSFRNPRHNPSIFGGDAVCSVETAGGRRKVGAKELLQIQKVMRVDLLAAPGEEVTLDITAPRRGQRAVARAAEWLKEILEAKAAGDDLGFEWHVLASIQGGADVKLRQKAAEGAAAMPVAGYWIGGLGYSEPLPQRAEVLQACVAALPEARPRFLPLNRGTPIEVLQAVLLGVDVLEVTYLWEVASSGIALTFDWEMPGSEEGADLEVLKSLQPQSEKDPPPAVRQLWLRAPECREDFGPISETSPVRQYSRAYLYHLHEVHELLGTMLLAQHNLHVYLNFFEAIRSHIRQDTLQRFAAWFLRTQTCAAPEKDHQTVRPAKRQKM